jgi:small nuclear ribonucleoprotein (snRNP)-like protein
MRKSMMFIALSVLFTLCAHAVAAEDPVRPVTEGTHVRVRLKTGEEMVGRILRKEPEGLTLAAEAGNQINIRDLANADIDSITPTVSLQRLNTISEFARRLPPGAAVQIRLVNGQKLEGKLLRVSARDLELDLTRGSQMQYRLVAYSEIRQIQMKAPRSGRPLLAAAPTLIYLALRVASAF